MENNVVYIIGGSGFIGKNMVRCYYKQYKILVVDKYIDGDYFEQYPEVETLQLDLADEIYAASKLLLSGYHSAPGQPFWSLAAPQQVYTLRAEYTAPQRNIKRNALRTKARFYICRRLCSAHCPNQRSA